MSGYNGQGRTMRYIPEYKVKVNKIKKNNMTGIYFRMFKSVAENYKFLVAFDTDIKLEKRRVFVDTRNRDIDEIVFLLLEELNSIGKINRVEKVTNDRCFIHFKNGDSFLLKGFNSRFIAWAYRGSDSDEYGVNI